MSDKEATNEFTISWAMKVCGCERDQPDKYYTLLAE